MFKVIKERLWPANTGGGRKKKKCWEKTWKAEQHGKSSISGAWSVPVSLMQTVSGPDFPPADSPLLFLWWEMRSIHYTSHGPLSINNGFKLSGNKEFLLWSLMQTSLKRKAQHFEVFNACSVLTPEYFSKISQSPPAHLVCCFFCNSTRISRLVSGLEIKATRVTSRVQSLIRSTRPGYRVIQKGYSTFPSALGWGTPKHNILACSGVSTHSSGKSVESLTGEQGPKAGAVQMHRDYFFLPRDAIWFHVPRSSLTLSRFLCHLTNVTAQAHQSLSVPGRETNRDKWQERSKWHMSLNTSWALSPPSLFSAKTSALYQAPCG